MHIYIYRHIFNTHIYRHTLGNVSQTKTQVFNKMKKLKITTYFLQPRGYRTLVRQMIIAS